VGQGYGGMEGRLVIEAQLPLQGHRDSEFPRHGLGPQVAPALQPQAYAVAAAFRQPGHCLDVVGCP
jgi:hypothetical protein